MPATITTRWLYRRLLEVYGPQGWWPAETPFEVIVGAILTQNTAWRNVERAISNLKKAGCLSPGGILSCSNLEDLIRPSGFYRQKAERLKAVSEFILRRGGLHALRAYPTRTLREQLLGIKGIGKETADSILLYAFDRPVFVVDKYTHRIFTRLGLWNGSFDYDGIREYVESEIKRLSDLKEFHALLVEHGKRYCRRRPLCEGCPIRAHCVYFWRESRRGASGAGRPLQGSGSQR